MKRIAILIFILSLFVMPTFAVIDSSALQSQQQQQEYINIAFWQKFNDDILVDNLIKVYENNNDLKAAVLKVNEGNRIVKMSFANELPHVGFQGYVGRIFSSSDELFGEVKIPNYAETHYLLPLTMNYEIDIWGKNHLITKSKKKQLEMIKQDERASYIYISSAFAVDYYNLIRTDKLISYQKELIELQNKIIDSYKTKYELGTATLSDIEQAQKNLTYMKEELQKLSEKQDLLKNQLSVLLSDRAFESIERAEFDSLNIAFIPPKEIKFDVIEKRPDKIKSELELEKIGIDVKVARRDLLPKFIITGNLGFNMYNISSSHKFLADLGIVPAWDLFMGGRKLQLLKLKKDQYEIATQRYEKTILTAIQETNDALYSMKTAGIIKTVVDDRLNNDEKEMKYTIIREDAGTADNLDILIQEQKLVISKMQTVSAKINEIISAINLYQALGGVDFTEIENI